MHGIVAVTKAMLPRLSSLKTAVFRVVVPWQTGVTSLTFQRSVMH